MQDVTVTDVTCLRIHSVTDNESCSSTYLCPNCVAACMSQLQDFAQHHCPCTCTQTRGKLVATMSMLMTVSRRF